MNKWRPRIGELVRYYDTDSRSEKVGTVLAFRGNGSGSYPYSVSDPEFPGDPWEMALGEMEPATNPAEESEPPSAA